MKILLYSIGIVLLLLSAFIFFKINLLKNIEYHKPIFLSDKKVLTVYYSNGGNTKSVAEILSTIIEGDIKAIKLYEKYPENIFTMSKIIRQQMKQGYLPDIENIDITNYDVIFVGSPIWNFSISLPIQSFLKSNNFENKTIIPFFTYSGGADKNKLYNQIKDITNAKDIKKPLILFENGILLTKEQIINWLNNI